VINLAAQSHVDQSITGPQDFITTNIVGAFVLLQAARRYWQGLPARPRRSVSLPARLDRRSVRLAGPGWAVLGDHPI
jgi:hypothetical protein